MLPMTVAPSRTKTVASVESSLSACVFAAPTRAPLSRVMATLPPGRVSVTMAASSSPVVELQTRPETVIETNP